MRAIQRAIRFVRPCQRALDAIDANLAASQDLQERLASLEHTLIDYGVRHAPDEQGRYQRRAGERRVRHDDTTEPR